MRDLGERPREVSVERLPNGSSWPMRAMISALELGSSGYG